MMIKNSIYLAVIVTTFLASLTLAQEPVLFDGTNPIVLSFQAPSGQNGPPADDAIPQSVLITPTDLAKELQSAKQKPLILYVGPRTLYLQAHIPDAEYIGTGSADTAQEKLRDRVKSLPKNSAIVLYCGCCPWSHCPNVHPTYQLLLSLGYTNVKVMYVATDFGTDWVNKGFPVAKGK